MLRNFNNALSQSHDAPVRRTRTAAGSKPARDRRLQLERLEPRVVLNGTTLVISEFMADNETTLADENGDFEDWLEIHNPTASPVDLDGWYLTDDAGDLAQWQIPALTIDPGEYRLVFASSKDRRDPAGQLHTDFKLSKNGEYLALSRDDGGIVTAVSEYTPEFPPQFDDISYGLGADWTTQGFFLQPTPGQPNAMPIDDPTQVIVISEIMYNPLGETYDPDTRIVLQEYIELYNRGNTVMDLTGWQISDGVEFTFPAVTLDPGEYLAVAAHPGELQAMYPYLIFDATLVGGWTGRLSNRGEEIDLRDDQGRLMDRVRYADEGDWAQRELGPVDHEHRGWQWSDEHDGEGRSLELIAMSSSNEYGQAWAASGSALGTPGQPNTVTADDIAPVILDVAHFPVIPRSTDTVTVTARLIDELATGVTASLHYRVDGAPGFSTVAMLDDGLSGDGAPGDGVYGATVGAQADGTVVEFYVQASDVGANTRTWPAPTQPSGAQLTNLLYQVDDGFNPDTPWISGSAPIYYLIMTEAERAELEDIGDGGDPFTGEGRSNAQMNGTFITLNGTETELHYNVGIRNRGNRSRVDPPNNYRVNIPHDRPWKDVTAINVNSKIAYDQVIGSAIFRMAGTAAPQSTPIEARVNGENLADNDSSMRGHYAALEVYDSDWADNQLPNEPNLNLYRGAYYVLPGGGRTYADLDYKGPAPYDDPDDYRENYHKQTNESEDDWTDLITLIDTLNNPGISDDDFFGQLSQVVDVQQWMRYMATDYLLGNGEGGLITGSGDDYAMYSGADGLFRLLPHDLDTLFSTRITDIWNYEDINGLERLMNDPTIQNIYLSQYIELIGTIFAPENFDPMVDEILDGVAPPSTINSMKQFVVNRSASVLSQIPQEFTVNSDLPVVDGFPQTNQSVAQLDGTAHGASTGSILVDGLLADWDPRTGRWSIGEEAKAPTVLDFQDGVSPDAGYAGTVDTTLTQGQGDVDHGSDAVFHVDMDSGTYGGGPAQAPLRFDAIFGDGPGQIPAGAEIANATLVLDVTNIGNNINVHRMLLPFNESDTWNIWTDGIQADGVEAAASADATINPASMGTISVNVTASLLAWQANPAGNHGWVLLPTGNDGARFSSREAATAANRPRLRITLGGPQVGDGVPLNPGINRLLVEAFDGLDGTGNLVDSTHIDVWSDPPTPKAATKAQTLDMTVRDSYLSDVPVLVRVEVLDDALEVDRDLWDAVATLSSDNPNVTISPDRVTLYNGLGTELVTVTGTEGFNLTATIGTLSIQTAASLVSLEGAPVTTISGPLAGDTTFSGVVHVTDDLIVPNGTTLTIDPGTLVLVTGVPSGAGGTVITVAGDVQSLGTHDRPVTLTAYTAGENWGEIVHNNAGPSLYQYTNITQAGHSTARGHSNTGPTIRHLGGVTTVFDHANLTDEAGKIMHGSSGDNLIFRDVVMARSVMGPEIWPASFLMEDTWITDMHHFDDADGIYVHSVRAGNGRMSGGVVAMIDDDGIDTLGAELVIEDWIVRDSNDKGLSIYDDEVWIRNSLIINNGKNPEDGIAASISSKGYNGDTVTVNMDHVTVVAMPLPGPDVDIAVYAWDKYGRPNVTAVFNITNSILVATDPIITDYDPADMHVDYTNAFSESWPGTGNLDADPLFVDVAGNDYHLRAGSPSIDAGDPASPLDPDGTRADQGYYVGNAGGLTPGIVPDTIGNDATLWPEAGPWRVSGNSVVEAGATLTILPGTTLFFDNMASLTINGRLLAEGTKYNEIRLTSTPGTDDWDGLRLTGTMQDNRISYAVIEGSHRNAGMLDLDNANLLVDHVTFDNAGRRRIATIESSLIVRNSVFEDFVFPGAPPDNVAEHIWGRAPTDPAGHFIIENNVFGATIGHNDAIDVDGNHRPLPVMQILGNVFLRSGDDALDFEGDAHIEGNVFMHVKKDQYNTGSGNANVISAGDAHGVGHDYVMVRNVFYDVDQVAQVKQNAFMTFVDNTVVGSEFAVLYFVRPTGGTPGRGAYLDGNIFVDTPVLFEDVRPETELTVHRSVFDVAPAGTDVTTLGEGNLFEDPRLADPVVTPGNAGGDFSLLPGSPALGSGPNGLDMGAMVPAGVPISGEPPVLTAQTNATLTVGLPGFPAASHYGPYSHYKFRINDGPWSMELAINTPLGLTGLPDGPYTIYAIGKNSAGVWQEDADATVSKTWTVDSSLARVRINEVLALNTSAYRVAYDPNWPDMIELINDGAVPVDIGGMSITDDPANPAKFVFPEGTVLAPGEFRVLIADDRTDMPGLHLGFALDGDGEGVYLFDAGAAAEDDPVDAVEFGPQIPDLSIGRVGQDGHWALTQPTFGTGEALGAANVPYRTGNPATLQINEWLADGEVLFSDDFIELYNPDPLPVALGGLYLTDRPIGSPAKHPIAPLSFVAGGGFVALTADGDPQDGPSHLDFRLSRDQEMIGLLDAQLAEIDKLIYYPQTTDVSQGRDPDGAENFEFFPLPTPGMSNVISDPDVVQRAEELLAGLRITEIMYHPLDDEDAEFIELFNVGLTTLNLDGVRLSDGIDFTFPPLMLPPGEHVVVVRDLAAFEARYGPGLNVAGQYEDNLSDGGEDVVLQLPAPLEAAVLRVDYNDAWYPTTDGGGFALEIRDPTAKPASWDEPESWQAGTVFGGTPASLGGSPTRNVLINEVLTHTDLPDIDFIELHNPTTAAINVGGWYLTDSGNNLRKFRIPDDTWIPGGGYVAFDEGDFNLDPEDVNSFALDGAHGDDAWLLEVDVDGNPVRVADHVVFGAAAAGESLGRWPDGSGPLYPMTGPTPEDTNSGPRVGPVIISELHYHPVAAEAMEFVEIYNSASAAVDLTGWRLRGGIKFDFPADTDLPAGSVLVVVPFDLSETATLAAFRAEYGIDETVPLVGGYGGQLDNGGEQVHLQRPDESPAGEPWYTPRLLEDQVIYDDVAPWPTGPDGGGDSLHRTAADAWGNAAASFSAAAPTPGRADSLLPDTYVLGRHIFYNNSVFDGNGPGANAADDLAIAPDKQALRPGGTATFANYTSYTGGINGIMVDIVNLPPEVELGADDFLFRVGNSNDPGTWSSVDTPDITVRPGEGVVTPGNPGGSDRITLIWPDNLIHKQWLQVTVLATTDTGLIESDVFYFGNAIGEIGNSTTDAKVNAIDMLGARDNQRNFFNPAEIDFNFDFDRNKRVNASDMLIARNNTTHFLNALRLITVPAIEAAEAGARLESGTAHDAVFSSSAQQMPQRPTASDDTLSWLIDYEQSTTARRASSTGRWTEKAIDLLFDGP